MSDISTSYVTYTLSWSPSRSKNRVAQYVIATIRESDGTVRRVEERCTIEHQSTYLLRVKVGATVSWHIKTISKDGVSNDSLPYSFTSNEQLAPIPAMNLSVDFLNSSDQLSPPSGEIVSVQEAETNSDTAPGSTQTRPEESAAGPTTQTSSSTETPPASQPASSEPPAGSPPATQEAPPAGSAPRSNRPVGLRPGGQKS